MPSEYTELLIGAENLSKRIKSLILETGSIKAEDEGSGTNEDGNFVNKQSEMINKIMERYSNIIGIC